MKTALVCDATLSEVTDILSGFAFKSELFNSEKGIPVVRIRDVVPGFSATRYKGNFDPAFVIEDGDILIGMDGEFNCGRWRGGRAVLNQRVCRIKARPSLLDESYLFHFLPTILKRIEASTAYVTVKHLSVKDIRGTSIPLPPLPEQRRIAAILDQADALRAKRRQVLARLDTLTQSIFLEMFGDPIGNEKHWKPLAVSDFVADFESGKSLAGPEEEEASEKWHVLKVSAVTSLEYRPGEAKEVPVGYQPPVSHIVRAGDLLFSRANTSELIGATAYVFSTPGGLLLPDKIWRFVWPPAPIADPIFVWHLFRHPAMRREIAQRASGTSGSMKNISQEKVMSIRTGLPPLDVQTAFADQVRSIERQRSAHRASLAQLDSLFTSLQYRAFRGEL